MTILKFFELRNIDIIIFDITSLLPGNPKIFFLYYFTLNEWIFFWRSHNVEQDYSYLQPGYAGSSRKTEWWNENICSDFLHAFIIASVFVPLLVPIYLGCHIKWKKSDVFILQCNCIIIYWTSKREKFHPFFLKPFIEVFPIFFFLGLIASLQVNILKNYRQPWKQ